MTHVQRKASRTTVVDIACICPGCGWTAPADQAKRSAMWCAREHARVCDGPVVVQMQSTVRYQRHRSPPPDAHPREVPAVVEARPGGLAVSDEEREPEGGPRGDDVR